MHDLSVYTPGREVRQREPREEDPAYLRSFKGRACEACGLQDDTVVGAHVRVGWFGLGKPHDHLVVALCYRCHDEEGANPGADWWMRVFKLMLKLRYAEWRMAR